MDYSEHRPRRELAPFVECVWFASEGRANVPAPPERVLPDGCVEWVFHFRDPFLRWPARAKGRPEIQPSSFVVGEMTRPLFVSPSGTVSTMGVRFRPGTAYRFLPVPLDALTDCEVATADLWGAGGRDLEDALRESRGVVERIALVERFLLGRLRGDSAERPRLDEAVRLLLKTRGRMAIEAISRRTGWSRRQLEREFLRSVGISPKALARVLRFQNALRLSGRAASPSWASIAADCGYADQSHLVRDFRELSGATPTEPDLAGDLTRNFVAPGRLDELLKPAADVAFLQDSPAASA